MINEEALENTEFLQTNMEKKTLHTFFQWDAQETPNWENI